MLLLLTLKKLLFLFVPKLLLLLFVGNFTVLLFDMSFFPLTENMYDESSPSYECANYDVYRCLPICYNLFTYELETYMTDFVPF